MSSINRYVESLRPALQAVVARALPGAELVSISPFGVDDSRIADRETEKSAGYGIPLELRARGGDGREHRFVFHVASADQFGHDRRADRAAEMLLAFDRFGEIPGHVRALDVGAIAKDGTKLISLADTGEFYLVTSFAPGHVYADELRAVAAQKNHDPRDLLHVEILARHLVTLHEKKHDDPTRYRRAVRDLVGGGEGIFGMIDAYGFDVPAAPPARLRAIEKRALDWRWRLRGRESRLARSHGDYHPFNVLFSDTDEIALLDASRGCLADPADDVTCMAINYVFFAVEHPGTWQPAFAELWRRFWEVYLDATRDREIFEVCAPFLAWRGLVVCNPVWYPNVQADARDRVLTLIERALAAERFDPSFADAVFV